MNSRHFRWGQPARSIRGVLRTAAVLGAWTFAAVPATALLLAAGGYVYAAREVGHRHPDQAWPGLRTASFVGGLGLVWVALMGPPGSLDDTFFWAHMVQHLILTMLAAPLILLGSPILLLLRASSRSFRHDVIVPVLRSRLMVALSHPVVGWLLFAGVLVGTHFSPFFDYALRHPVVHEFVEHPLFLGAALVFYYPLLPGNPSHRRVAPAWRAISLFLMMLPETMTGFFIYASDYVLYPFYATAPRPFGPAPVADQQLAGALMWSGSMLIDALWVSVAVLDWLHSEEERSRRIDLQTLLLPRLPAGGPS
jgi:cytochrome c oxidase assembly factor CtaG